MNNTANTYFCEQCRESVKRGAKICPHCSSEQHPAPCKTCRKQIKKGSKLVAAFAAFVAFLLAPFLVWVVEQHPAPCKTCRKKNQGGIQEGCRLCRFTASPISDLGGRQWLYGKGESGQFADLGSTFLFCVGLPALFHIPHRLR